MTLVNKWILTALSILPFAVGQISHATPFYKWIDEQGATHYTQTPPPQKEAKKIDVSTHLPADSDTAIKNLNSQNKARLKDDNESDEAADKAKTAAAAETARRAKNAPQCQNLRSSLALLQSGRRLRTVDANGGVIVTEDKKVSDIQNISAQINKDCP